MTRTDRREHNRRVILSLATYNRSRESRRPMGYREAVRVLNEAGKLPTTGKPWTCRSLYRMLQRSGFSGLHGLTAAMREGALLTP